MVAASNSGDQLEAKQVWEADVIHYLSEDYTPTAVRMINIKPIPEMSKVLPDIPVKVEKAFWEQSIIGWNHFIRGSRLSNQWKRILMVHLASHRTETI